MIDEMHELLRAERRLSSAQALMTPMDGAVVAVRRVVAGHRSGRSGVTAAVIVALTVVVLGMIDGLWRCHRRGVDGPGGGPRREDAH